MICVSDLGKSFDGVEVLGSVSFDVLAGSVCALVGPSGCGKSTLLNLIAKMDTPSCGKVTAPSAGGRIGYMMQDPLLLPWRTLEENATLGAEIVLGKKPASSRLDAHLESFDLLKDKAKYPEAASGGMKQRIALVRTLLVEPVLLLLDEPFANLDFDIKLRVQKYLLRYHHEHWTTIVWVTHDIEDAIAISDQVFVLSDKPTMVKAVVGIDLGLVTPNPVEARKSAKFREYFVQVWDQLKYLDDNDGR